MCAHMCPAVIRDIDPRSKEDLVFRALKKLPDDYYVFHSFEVTNVIKGQLYEREADFIVVNRDKGIMYIECKAGNGIEYRNGDWYYTSGKVMERKGPYKQVTSARGVLKDKMEYHKKPEVRDLIRLKKIRWCHAVWFIDMIADDFRAMNNLPPEATEDITLFSEDLINPKNKIEKIFSLKRFNEDSGTESLTDAEFRTLLNDVLCPYCKLVTSPRAKVNEELSNMDQLLREQFILLDFLEETPSAVINGAAGTGKTMIAAEKAGRNSENGEKVLFLCYNSLLRSSLEERYKENGDPQIRQRFANVEFRTISALAKQVTGNMEDFDGLLNWLTDTCMKDLSKFDYQHVIIDEGQDFGMIDDSNSADTAAMNVTIIDALQELAAEKQGTFYLFYDKYQNIQGADEINYELPSCINDADVKLTLRTNCRNTHEIASTSMTPLKDKRNRAIKPQTLCFYEETPKPSMHIITDDTDTEAVLQTVLYKYKQAGIEDVVILTPNTIEYSNISHCLEQGKGKNAAYWMYSYMGSNFRVTTSRKFKGLEADAIVVLDLDKDSFKGKKGLQFYVGTSRAKLRLDLICTLQPDDYYTVVHSIDPNAPDFSKNAKKMRNMLGNIFQVSIAD